jgi:hypothetical protein
VLTPRVSEWGATLVIKLRRWRIFRVATSKTSRASGFFSAPDHTVSMADRAVRAARRRSKSAETSDDSDGSTSDEGEPSELPMCTTHEKVHLEVTDSQHRYAKHLRMYHREWESRGSVGSFWDWVDAEPLVTLPDCPRERLQECRVAYLYQPEERAPYIVEVHQGRFYHPENRGTGEERRPYSTGEGEWIFVFSSARVRAALPSLACHNQNTSLRPSPPRMPLRVCTSTLPRQVLFCHRKTRGAFHHTSFLAGGPCIAAGTLVIHGGASSRALYYMPLSRGALYYMPLSRGALNYMPLSRATRHPQP